MSRTNDIVLVFNGGDPFSKLLPIDDDVNTKLYFRKLSTLNYKRSLLAESRGSGLEDVNATIDAAAKMISDFVKGRFDTIDKVCLLGRSAGYAVALGLAGELQSKGVNRLTFVGVSDVPMWDAGWVPPVRHVGKIKPVNGPIATGAVSPNPGLIPMKSPVPQNEIPFANLDIEIKADKLINLYQIKGNHMKYARSLNRWIWWSDLSGGEVHGKLGGKFDNRFRDVKGNLFLDFDLSVHVNLNTGPDWKAMCSEAANALADLPAQPLP